MNIIIIGYQGIGKSTLANRDERYIDLESSNFFVDGKRPDNWHIVYCNIALSLARQGYCVFVSSHKAVRDYLSSIPDVPIIAIVHPSLALKDEWIVKLKERYDRTGLQKDFKAWKNAESDYESNITELISEEGFYDIEITSMDYDLHSLMSRYIMRLCFGDIQ